MLTSPTNSSFKKYIVTSIQLFAALSALVSITDYVWCSILVLVAETHLCLIKCFKISKDGFQAGGAILTIDTVKHFLLREERPQNSLEQEYSSTKRNIKIE